MAAGLVTVALVFIGAHGDDQFLYRRCVAIQNGVPPSLAGIALPPNLVRPSHHVLTLGSNISGYAPIGTELSTVGSGHLTQLHLFVRCERGWP